MAVQTTSNLTNSIRTQYINKYLEGAMAVRLYDQLAVPYNQFAGGMSMAELQKGSSVQINFLSDMIPGTSVISELTDVTPQTLVDATASVTPTSRGEALQWSEKLSLQVYTDYTARAYEAVGKNMMESVELLAIQAALQGTWVTYPGSHVTRATLDAGTSGDRASDAIFRQMHGMLMSLKTPGFVNASGEANTWTAIMHPYCFHDISESGNVDSIGLYQDEGIHLNFELGKIGPFRLVVSPWAKVFASAGAANGTAVATTVNTAAAALATTVVTAADVSANIAKGLYWTVGTIETANTFYATNERIKPISASTVTVTFLGEAPNGGFRFPHAAGATVSNADSVYPIVFGGPQSLVKLFATDVGEYGSTVGPKTDGMLDQFNTLGWKYYGGYGRISENRILRMEVSTSYEA